MLRVKIATRAQQWLLKILLRNLINPPTVVNQEFRATRIQSIQLEVFVSAGVFSSDKSLPGKKESDLLRYFMNQATFLL